jgi:acyl-coenzyme A synthetase/AMP-(fatty) acid ligase
MNWFVDKVKRYYPEIELQKISQPHQVCSLPPGDPLPHLLSIIEYGGILTFGDIPEASLPASGFVLTTSGSTGFPKHVLYSFDTFLEKFRDVECKPVKTVMVMGLDHIGGLDVYFSVISRGGKVFFPNKVCVDEVCQIIEKEKIDFVSLPPTFINLMIMAGAPGIYDLTSLKVINFGAEPMPPSLLELAKDIFSHAELRQTFGTTETGTLKVVRHPTDPLFIKIPNSKVVDGKLYVKSAHGMIGYLDRDSPFEDGYFPTGDVVKTWGDYVRIMGRETDAINVGGYKVSPVEVEEMIRWVRGVKDVLVYGEPNLITGNILVADVVWENPYTDSTIEWSEPPPTCAEAIKADLKGINKHKIPSKIRVVSEIKVSDRLKKVRK